MDLFYELLILLLHLSDLGLLILADLLILSQLTLDGCHLLLPDPQVLVQRLKFEGRFFAVGGLLDLRALLGVLFL